MTAQEIVARLQALGDPLIAAGSTRFFKTGRGQYGEGDVFVGVRVPALHKLAREFQATPLNELDLLLNNEIHEARLLSLLILVRVFAKADNRLRKQIYDLYLANTARVNNWDLVDSSAPPIVGGYLESKSRKPLYRLARSRQLWERRISIVATQHFIRRGDFVETLAIAALLLPDEHDLIHKAVGWMLREVGKRDPAAEQAFLDEHAASMPRTMLRYAIERFPPAERTRYLSL